ncbi:tetratricopeptide repeat protein [Vibrio ostreicida]|uniref:Tetratricopeptide repeat protein n=1 Tax=Vibrio ostreicida TaxID=526588 RepID=A0ABT8BYP0_9VIBR|nr:tetratricopeptide repeat protein [Vibrio ostreicida]MDN3612285.1 tetratricopeptide repeat protein [Vibrio ostreicida]NPD08668.1 tetratricopeptide repeat protein [Vibrio ostreicida]
MKSWIWVWFSLLAVGCQSTGQDTHEEDFQLAQTAMTNGHAENALSIYKQKLKESPDDPRLLFLAGSACNQAARYDEALHYLVKGHQLAPSAAFERELGRAHLALGNISLASAALEHSVVERHQDDVALNSLGVSYALNRQYGKARQSFQEALTVRPDSEEYKNNLALSWLLDGQPQHSIEILYPIYQRGEASRKLRLNLALSYAFMGRLDAARAIASQDLSKAELENNLEYYQRIASLEAPVW